VFSITPAEYAPLALILIGILFFVKWERDKYVSRRAYHQAYLDGVKDGAEQAKEAWRGELEESARKGLAEILEKYPTVVRVIDKSEAMTVADYKTRFDVVGESVVELPRVSFTIVVDSKTRVFPKAEELKVTWERMA
jgi:hypothetical protein